MRKTILLSTNSLEYLEFSKVNTLFSTDTLPLKAFGESDQLPNKMVEREVRNAEEARNLGARNMEGRKVEENTKELYNELHRLRQENSEEWRKREESESNLSEMKRQLRREVSQHLFYNYHISRPHISPPVYRIQSYSG